MSQSIDNILNNALDGIKKLTEVDTIIGKPVQTPDNTTIIPVSKASFGFVAGGSSFGKSEDEKFAGGAGGGVKLTPIAFLIINENGCKILNINENPDVIDKLASVIPDSIDKISNLIKKNQKEDKAE